MHVACPSNRSRDSPLDCDPRCFPGGHRVRDVRVGEGAVGAGQKEDMHTGVRDLERGPLSGALHSSDGGFLTESLFWEPGLVIIPSTATVADGTVTLRSH